MNPNLWNIKEILSIPTGSSGTKAFSRNVAASGYPSLTDSQFAFGSQFWPENSQAMSQEMSVSSRNSQQSSQEGSEPKLSSNYHTKPFLFGGEGKAGAQKTVGILDKFEEDKKKAKDKGESDHLARECLHFRDSLNNMHQLIVGTEKNTAVCKTILEGFNKFATALQTNLASLQSGISQQFEAMLNKVSSQKEMLTEMEQRVHKTGVTTTELGSHVHSLQINLEALREEQRKEQNMLEEALNLLSTLVSKYSTKPSPGRVIESASQTSPWLVQPFSNIQRNDVLERRRVEVPSQDLWGSCIMGKKICTSRGQRRCRKRPLVLSQRGKGTVQDENRKPLTNRNTQEIVSTPLHDLNKVVSPKADALTNLSRASRYSAAGGFISPVSFWSQDSNSSPGTTGTEPNTEKLPAESAAEIPGKAKDLWQLFDINCGSD